METTIIMIIGFTLVSTLIIVFMLIINKQLKNLYREVYDKYIELYNVVGNIHQHFCEHKKSWLYNFSFDGEHKIICQKCGKVIEEENIKQNIENYILNDIADDARNKLEELGAT